MCFPLSHARGRHSLPLQRGDVPLQVPCRASHHASLHVGSDGDQLTAESVNGMRVESRAKVLRSGL